MNKTIKTLLKMGVAIAGVIVFKGKLSKTGSVDTVKRTAEVVEETFGGISKTKLDKIADECRRGGYVSIIGDKLYYHFKSGRGHQVNHAEYIIDRVGKFQKMTAGGYPGQLNFPDIDFLNKVNSIIDNK